MAPWMTTLQGAKIREATQKHYLAVLVLLCGWLRRRTIPLWTNAIWDEELAEFLEVLYDEQAGFVKAQRLLPALLWALPELGLTSKVAFPRAWQSLMGWRKLCPPRSRPPVLFGAIMLICRYMLMMGRFEAAFMVALALETYLRPSELLALTGQQVTLPAASGPGAARFAAIAIHAEELQIESNTGQFDGCMLLDLARQEWMVLVLRALKRKTTHTGPL